MRKFANRKYRDSRVIKEREILVKAVFAKRKARVDKALLEADAAIANAKKPAVLISPPDFSDILIKE